MRAVGTLLTVTATVNVPVPQLPRWVSYVAGAGWLLLLAASAAVRTQVDDEGIAMFVADVIATGAGVGFALIGIAAWLPRWERRRLLVETAETSAIEFNLMVSTLRRLIEEVLRTMESLTPSVRMAGPENLSWLLCPPANTHCRQLMIDIGTAVLINEPRNREQRDALLATLPAEAPPEAMRLEHQWRLAKWAARDLSAHPRDDASADVFIQAGAPHWREAVDLAHEIGAQAEAVEAAALASGRLLRKDVRRLLATVTYQSSPQGHLEPMLEGRWSHRSRESYSLALYSLAQVLDCTLEVCADVAAIRAELADIVEADDSPVSALSEMRRLEGEIALRRELAEEAVSGTLAFEWRMRFLGDDQQAATTEHDGTSDTP